MQTQNAACMWWAWHDPLFLPHMNDNQHIHVSHPLLITKQYNRFVFHPMHRHTHLCSPVRVFWSAALGSKRTLSKVKQRELTISLTSTQQMCVLVSGRCPVYVQQHTTQQNSVQQHTTQQTCSMPRKINTLPAIGTPLNTALEVTAPLHPPHAWPTSTPTHFG